MFKRLTGIFERLVRPILLGYLGKYVKDIQLKIAVWKEEVVSLEHVELALDAFDHLQLPFAMKFGKVDRLSIKVPWTKLGSQPIEITFEGVRICVSPRDDQEWSWDAVEKREIAAKKARLAAAEIANFSTQACENQAGQLFTAKILDSIQVSIRNVNILYCDQNGCPAPILFGFKFSSLTIMKQIPIGGGNQVHKSIEIEGFEIYSRVVQEDTNIIDVANALFEGEKEKCDTMLAQCAVSMLISIKRTGKLDLVGPKYFISANVDSLVISLEKNHLHQFMILSDYLCTCRLREKYGRFRPSFTPSRSSGWQILWWHYAVESVLLDVRKKLKRTSWRYCSQRLGYCRKYINLYKRKLHFIQQGQSIGEDILLQLEQMEEDKELDVDDILSLRSAAEYELQELLSNSSVVDMDTNGSNFSSETSGNDESSISKSRGWLNVLSRGVLGAGGADGTSQFAGVVSDEVKMDVSDENNFSLSSVHIKIHQICATFWSKEKARVICKLNFKDAIVDCEISENSAVISTIIESAMMENKCGEEIVHLSRKALVENGAKDGVHSSSDVHMELLVKHGNELLFKGLFPKLEVNFDAECFTDLIYFFDVLKSLNIQNERVLSLLSKIEDADARLISKVEHLLSSHQIVVWDVSISDVTVYVPSSNAEQHMVFGLGALLFKSKSLLDSSSIGGTSYTIKDYLSSRSLHNMSEKFKLQHLYDHFEIKLAEFEMKMKMPNQSEKIPILEKFSTCVNVAHCLISDEAMLRQLEVHVVSSNDNFCDFHCHPFAIGFLAGFIISLSAHEPSTIDEKSIAPIINNGKLPSFEFQQFGFSNYPETGSSEWASIPLYHYPFITIQNSGLLDSLDSSLLHSSPYWGKKINATTSPDLSFKRGSSFSHTSQLKSTTTIEGVIHSSTFGATSVLRIDLQLSRVRVHFHDSSCIIGTITLPAAKSSICISGDSLDILCSAVGLSLNSSWYEPSFYGSLWGPSSPKLSPVLNLRFKKERHGKLALSIGIHHVCCILPSEYLAIIIGYFSLSDWSPNNQSERESHVASDTENDYSILYKFEVLDSTLVMPIESSDHQFLKVEIPQLYCSFLGGSSSNDMLKGIPSECFVTSCKSGTRLHYLNIFGRNLSMSSLFSKDDESGSSMIDTGNGLVDYCVVNPLSADVWVRIPLEDELSCEGSSLTTSVMAKIKSCQVVANGDPFFYGFKALMNAIDQFSTLSDQSKFFKSNILQFRQLKRSIVKASDVLVVASGLVLTEIRCSIDELLMKICLKNKAVAMAKMQLLCSAFLNGDTLLSMSVDCPSLELYSLPNATLLAQFNSVGSSLSVLEVFLSKTVNNEDELLITLPSLDIWLHLSNWTEVVESIIYYAKQNENQHLNTTSKNLTLWTDDSLINSGVSYSSNTLNYSSDPSQVASKTTMSNTSVLIIRSDNMSIMFHFPLCVSEVNMDFEVAGDYKEAYENNGQGLNGKQGCNSISVACHSRSTEVLVNGGNVKLNSDWERLSGTVSLCENNSVLSWPLFHMLKFNIEAEIVNNQMDPKHVKLVVECDHSDFSLSHRVLCLWRRLQFDVPEAGSSNSFSSINFEVHLKEVSFLLSDGRWNCGGALFQLLLQSIILHGNFAEDNVDGLLTADLQVDYNNIHKVSWEPFLEPWQFQLIVGRKSEINALLDSSMITYIDLKSTKHLSLNITESLVECISRTIEMIKDAWGLKQTHSFPKNQMLQKSPYNEYAHRGRYASYVIKNLTSVPFIFHVYQGTDNVDMSDITEEKDRNYVKPGCCVSVFMNETPEEQPFPLKPARSSDSLSEKQSDGVAHHFITFQFDGMSMPTAPISMDLVRQTYFEADFSKTYGSDAEKTETYSGSGYVVPVVFDVSVQRSIKLIQLYSTVLLLNTTSTQLELWFDIPFGVSSKRLGPLNPCQELPLPLHSSEAGRLRWCPVGDSHLCSEAYDISTLISHESKIGTFKSSVCYPSRASGHPFYCCLSVVKIRLNSSSHLEKGTLSARRSSSVQNSVHLTHLDEYKQLYVHRVIISTPLVVNNYLPVTVKLSIQTTGGDLTAYADLPEMGTSFHYIDPLRDLKVEINIHGFHPQYLQFPHGETFFAMAKFNGTKFLVSETVRCMPLPYTSNGPMHVTLEKMRDAISGTRELHLSVPFLLYNCTGFPLSISESSEMGISCIIPPCYEFDEQEYLVDKKDGLSLLSSCHKSPHNLNGLKNSLTEDRNLSTWVDDNSLSGRLLHQTSMSSISSNINGLGQQKSVLSSPEGKSSSSQFNHDANVGYEKVRAYMYSPKPVSSGNELTVKVSRCPRESTADTLPSSFWSNAFSLAPPSGSTTVLVPQLSSSGSLIISAALTAVSGPLTGRTSAVTFQPRYVISNACNKKLRFKQKGTGAFFCLHERKQAQIHWTDSTRDLLVSICYDEPGWEWSGGFSPDHLGDIQVKMRNSSGAVNVIRVELQNADASTGDENIVGNLHGNSGTNLILLSEDDTEYMPYRIDNFSKESLRIYQQKCETYATSVQSYSSSPYAWDEPCYPHNLIVEVPGERVLGSYALDDVKVYLPVYLPLTSEKPERTLYLSVRAEGATKVLSVIDSKNHNFDTVDDLSISQFGGKKKSAQKDDKFVNWTEKLGFVIPYMTLSLINSYPEEVLFAYATNVTINLLQSLDRQKLSFQISSMQIENPSRVTPYPVTLSFDHGCRCNVTDIDCLGGKAIDQSGAKIGSDQFSGPVFYLTVSKWRKKDVSLVSFEYIILRVGDICLKLEEEMILKLIGLVKNISSTLQGRVVPFSEPLLQSPIGDTDLGTDLSKYSFTSEYFINNDGQNPWTNVYVFDGSDKGLPLVVPIGAPWQRIYLLARRQKKVYVEVFDVGPININFSFSSNPWMTKNGLLKSGEYLIHRSLMALTDVEGARINFKPLKNEHLMASWKSVQDIIMRHYSRQVLHEMYKVFGSAGVIGNPVGFARNVVLGIRDFLSVPARSILQSPGDLITGMAQGTTSLLGNTIYAISDAATQFSKAAHKGVVVFTFDDQAVSRLEKQESTLASSSKGVINDVLEGLTGLLQLPINEVEKRGLPGILSGVALGITGLVAKPTASILKVTEKTAASIRNRSMMAQMGRLHFRTRLPRCLSEEVPLRPYSWEEAIGASVLRDIDDGVKYKDEVLVVGKALKKAGQFVVMTKRLVLVVYCSSLVDLGKPQFRGIAIDPEWVIESEISLENVIQHSIDEEVIHIVVSIPDTISRQKHNYRRGDSATGTTLSSNLPIFLLNLEFPSMQDAQHFLQILKSTIERQKEKGGARRLILHQETIRHGNFGRR